MKLCYRGVDYEIAPFIPPQPMSITPATLIYRGNPYQRNQYQLMPHGIGTQQSITNQLPLSCRKTTTASLRLIYRGVAYVP